MSCKKCNKDHSPYKFSDTWNEYCEVCINKNTEYISWLFRQQYNETLVHNKDGTVFPNREQQEYIESKLWELNNI